MSSFKETLKETLQLYLEKNEQCSRLSKELQLLRQDKQEIEDSVLDILKVHHQENKVFVLNDVKVQHKSCFQYQQLSLKFLESCIQDYIQQKQIQFPYEDFMTFLRDKREKKSKDELRIFS